MGKWWEFWKWHRCRCRTESDDTGCWGECVICHKRYGFVTRRQLRDYADRELERHLIQKLREIAKKGSL